MKRLMKNDNGSLLLNFGHYQAKPALETKYSLFEKKSTKFF